MAAGTSMGDAAGEREGRGSGDIGECERRSSQLNSGEILVENRHTCYKDIMKRQRKEERREGESGEIGTRM